MDGRIFSLKQILSERLDRNWTVAEMAHCFNLSVPHFQKLFKAQIGTSPIAYLRELRLEKARELLETTYLQIKQIRLQTGIMNDSHFTREFTKKFGVSPTEYRKNFWEMEQSNPPNGKE